MTLPSCSTIDEHIPKVKCWRLKGLNKSLCHLDWFLLLNRSTMCVSIYIWASSFFLEIRNCADDIALLSSPQSIIIKEMSRAKIYQFELKDLITKTKKKTVVSLEFCQIRDLVRSFPLVPWHLCVFVCFVYMALMLYVSYRSIFVDKHGKKYILSFHLQMRREMIPIGTDATVCSFFFVLVMVHHFVVIA